MRVPAKPLPISNPLVAGSDIMAFGQVGVELVEDGFPKPAGTPRATNETTPPSESPSRRACRWRRSWRRGSGSGHRVGSASTGSRVTSGIDAASIRGPD